MHRYYSVNIKVLCEDKKTTLDDVLILLGDTEINYLGDPDDRELKRYLASLPITLLCVHGNHDKRPENIGTYNETLWCGGVVYVEPDFPNILFAKCGEVYTLGGHRFMAIGGAYSVDKDYRLVEGLPWFPDEQPSGEIMKRVNDRLEAEGWQIDWIFSHTCPYKYLPRNTFIFTEEHLIDQTTEKWLNMMESRLTYKHWYCGHFHIDKQVDKIDFLSGIHFIQIA
jgi:3-oxoacid CoA-transferase subunit A